MATVNVTSKNPIEESSRAKALQFINDNCNVQQLEVVKRMVGNVKLNEILKQSTMDKLEKNLPMLKSFL